MITGGRQIQLFSVGAGTRSVSAPDPERREPAREATEAVVDEPSSDIGIYRLTRQYTIYEWLCSKHVAIRTQPSQPEDMLEGKHGWTAEIVPGPTPPYCVDCRFSGTADGKK